MHMGENKYKFLIIKLDILYEHYKSKEEIYHTNNYFRNYFFDKLPLIYMNTE